MMRETPPQLMIAAEVALWLRIRCSTIYAWSATGKIPSLRLNGTLRFVRTDIQRWLNDCSSCPADSHLSMPHLIIPPTPTAVSHQSIKEAGARAIRHVTNRKLLQRNPTVKTPFLSDNAEERKDRA